VDVAGEVVVVTVDIADDGSDMAVDMCDIGCDEGLGGEVSVGRMEGLGLGMSWSELWVGLSMIPLLSLPVDR
jgi:hypothetical protein